MHFCPLPYSLLHSPYPYADSHNTAELTYIPPNSMLSAREMEECIRLFGVVPA
jgi:hypothetical protein